MDEMTIKEARRVLALADRVRLLAAQLGKPDPITQKAHERLLLALRVLANADHISSAFPKVWKGFGA